MSGGLYYASAVLAPEGWGPLASVSTTQQRFLKNIYAYILHSGSLDGQTFADL